MNKAVKTAGIGCGILVALFIVCGIASQVYLSSMSPEERAAYDKKQADRKAAKKKAKAEKAAKKKAAANKKSAAKKPKANKKAKADKKAAKKIKGNANDVPYRFADIPSVDEFVKGFGRYSPRYNDKNKHEYKETVWALLPPNKKACDGTKVSEAGHWFTDVFEKKKAAERLAKSRESIRNKFIGKRVKCHFKVGYDKFDIKTNTFTLDVGGYFSNGAWTIHCRKNKIEWPLTGNKVNGKLSYHRPISSYGWSRKEKKIVKIKVESSEMAEALYKKNGFLATVVWTFNGLDLGQKCYSSGSYGRYDAIGKYFANAQVEYMSIEPSRTWRLPSHGTIYKYEWEIDFAKRFPKTPVLYESGKL